MDDRLEEMLAEGPANDEEAYELDSYVQRHIDDLHRLRMEALGDIEDLKSRYRQLGRDMDNYRIKVRRVLSDFDG